MTHVEDKIRSSLKAAADLIPEENAPIGLSARQEKRRVVRGPVVALAALVVVIVAVGGGSLLLFNLGSGNDATSSSEVPAPVAGTASPIVDPLVGGSDGLCDPAVSRGTLYLGGPTSESNLAVPGFIYSLPLGRTPIEAAVAMVSQTVVGPGCEPHISGSIQSDVNKLAASVFVAVSEPAAPIPMHLTVETLETSDVIGVTSIIGSVPFEVVAAQNQFVLRLNSEVPSQVVEMSIRFRKGEDVWELSVDKSAGWSAALIVPAGEADRFPDAEPEWVLFTLRDAVGNVLDAGGRLIP